MKRLIALFLVFVLLLLPSCSGRSFNYVTEDITEYYDLLLSEITGGTYEIDLPSAITEADVLKEFRHQQLINAFCNYLEEPALLDKHTEPPGYGDYAHIYYDVAMTPDGDGVVTNLFSDKGEQIVIIGEWEFPEDLKNEYHPLFDNETVHTALMQTMPVSRVTEGVVEAGDVVVLDFSYTYADPSGQDKLMQKVDVRIDTGSLSSYEAYYGSEFLSAILGKTIGEKYTATYTAIPASEGVSATTYTCDVVITHLLEESYTTLPVAIPEGTFNEEYTETMQAMNGKTVYLRYYIARYADFDTPEMDNAFFIDMMGLKTEETDPARVKEIAIAEMKAQMELEQIVSEVFPKVTEVFVNKLTERKDRVKRFPRGLVDDEYNSMMDACIATYESTKAKAESEGAPFIYDNIDEFAAYYFAYSTQEFPTMVSFCKKEAEYQVTLRLMMFAIAQVSGIRRAQEEYTAMCDEYMETLLAKYAPQYTQAYNRDVTVEDIYAMYGSKEKYYFQITFTEVQAEALHYLYENNTWVDNTP